MTEASPSRKLKTHIAVLLAVSALVSGCGGDDSAALAATSQPGTGSPSSPSAPSIQAVTSSMRAQWKTYITGGNVDQSDPDIQSKIKSIGTTAQNDQNSMIPVGTRTTCLWSDLCTWTASSNLTNNYKRIQEMVLGYSTQGSTLYGDATLLGNILDALQWMHDNHYNPSIAQFDNWWDWEIGIPKIIGNMLITLYDRVPADLRNQYIAAMDHFNADPTNETWPAATPPTVMTGANLLDKVMGRVFSGLLADDGDKITAARNAMQAAYIPVTSDDGFYADGSFIQHHYLSYLGNYGGVLFDDMTNLMFVTANTQWAFSNAEIQTVAGWANNTAAPLLYQGAMMDMTRGRMISVSSTTDHVAGRSLTVSMRRIADAADPATAAQINNTVKGWMLAEKTFNTAAGCTSGCYFTGMSLFDLARMKALFADSTVSGTQLKTSRVFGSMAQAVHLQPTFGFGLSMFSDRISSFEYGNNQNKQGWLTGAGRTAIYTDDQKQYSNNYWATVDYGRLSGTTVDGATFTAPVNWSFYGNALGNLRWTGGSSVVSAYSSAGMEFDMSGFLSQERVQGGPLSGRTSPSGVSGRKSWFMMDDRIIALGSDIADTVGRPVETIVDNRRLIAPYTGNAGGNNKLTINNVGDTTANLGGGAVSIANVNWAHIQGSSQSTCSPAVNGSSCTNGSNGVGYLFFSPQTVTALREARTSSWSTVGTGSTTSVTDNYLSLAIPHGTNPTSAAYAYVLLPNKSAAEVSAIAANPGMAVLSNGNGIHAVKYTPASGTVTKVVGANFWTSTGGTVTDGGQSYLTSSTKASVTAAETANGVSLAVSDPTEANTGSITVTLTHPASSTGMLDSAVTVIQLQPTIKFSVNVNAAHGRSIAANFNY